MGILSNLKPKVSIRPPKMVVYGVPGIGKTSFALGAVTDVSNNITFPETDAIIAFNIEDGMDGMAVTQYPVRPDEGFPRGYVFKNIYEVLNALEVVLTEEHTFQRLVIDSLDWVEKLIWDQVCRENNVASIEEIPYARGYKFSDIYWDKFLSLLDQIRDQRNMMVIMTAHSNIKRFEDPDSDGYERYVLDIHKHICGRLVEWCDMILFAKEKVYINQKDAGFGQKVNKTMAGGRVLFTTEKPAHQAKNRYGLPEEMPMDWPLFYQTLMQSMNTQKSQEPTQQVTTAQAQPELPPV